MDEKTAKIAYSFFDEFLDASLGWDSEHKDITKKKKELKERKISQKEYDKLDQEIFWEFLQKVTK